MQIIIMSIYGYINEKQCLQNFLIRQLSFIIMLSILIFFLYFSLANAYVQKLYTYIVFHCTQVHISKHLLHIYVKFAIHTLYNVQSCTSLQYTFYIHRSKMFICQRYATFLNLSFLVLNGLVIYSFYIFLQIKSNLLNGVFHI